ncbi:nuclear transport factor 2 family protein [Immundisolibacter sp.]|uniref:nuclear transport factor 2 family protein n=1 Tax=Immundisolibacter sp. TaxID=1934948 RepID=UPI0035695852
MQDVFAADDARTAALIAADRPALERTLARQLHYVHSNGLVQDRAAYLDAAVGGAMQYTTITSLQRQARPLADAVVALTGSNHVEVVLDGKPLQANVLYTAIYVQEGGAWKLSVWQSTPAPARP